MTVASKTPVGGLLRGLLHPTRAAVYTAACKTPGVYATGLADKAIVANANTVHHHLVSLAADGLLFDTGEVSRGGARARFFPTLLCDPAAAAVIAALGSPQMKEVCDTVASCPGMTAGEVAASLGKKLCTVLVHLSHGVEKGLLTTGLRGKRPTYTANYDPHALYVPEITPAYVDAVVRSSRAVGLAVCDVRYTPTTLKMDLRHKKATSTFFLDLSATSDPEK